MRTTLLTPERFKTTFSSPMQDITGKEDVASPAGVVDVWPYVDAVPEGELEGVAIVHGRVDYVYRSADGRYDHVLVATEKANVFLAVVVDLMSGGIYGHHLLDLEAAYGLRAANDPK